MDYGWIHDLSKENVQMTDKPDILKLILSIMHDEKMSVELFDKAYKMIEEYLDGKIRVYDARQMALTIHKIARMNPDTHQRLLYRAWGHAVASIHVKTHVIPMLNYLKKYHETKE